MKSAAPKIVKRMSLAKLEKIVGRLAVAKSAKQAGALKRQILAGYYGRPAH